MVRLPGDRNWERACSMLINRHFFLYRRVEFFLRSTYFYIWLCWGGRGGWLPHSLTIGRSQRQEAEGRSVGRSQRQEAEGRSVGRLIGRSQRQEAEGRSVGRSISKARGRRQASSIGNS